MARDLDEAATIIGPDILTFRFRTLMVVQAAVRDPQLSTELG
jgi:hypothetical protein